MAAKIGAPVGPWNDDVVKSQKGNRKSDIKLVQKMLVSAAIRLKNQAINPGTPDGLISKTATKSDTLKAIAAFQKRFLFDVNQRVEPDSKLSKKIASYYDPAATKTIVIDGEKLSEFITAMTGGHCKYGWGAKASPLTIEPAKVKKLDCSGFVQYLLYTVTSGKTKTRGGSWHQNEYFSTHNFEQVEYSTNASKKDGILRIGYFKRINKTTPGHIWFILDGQTIESHGGKGPNRRDWSTSKLKTRVKRCYVIGKVTAKCSIPRPHRPLGKTMYA